MGKYIVFQKGLRLRLEKSGKVLMGNLRGKAKM